MKTKHWLGCVLAVVAASSAWADDFPQPIEPTPEHEWLTKFVGEWESTCELQIPGQSPVTSEGTESARMLGELWLICEGEANIMGQNMSTMLMLGFDPEQQQFVGSWVDSANGYIWNYEGTLDEATQTLVLQTRGPCPFRGGEHSNFRESIRLVDENHKVFTSEIQNEDGTWEKVMTAEATRTSR